MSLIPPDKMRTAKLGDGEEYEMRAPGDPLYNVDDEKERAMVVWRSECLERLGFDLSATTMLALRRDVDVHDVKRMLQGGATHAQVMAIAL